MNELISVGKSEVWQLLNTLWFPCPHCLFPVPSSLPELSLGHQVMSYGTEKDVWTGIDIRIGLWSSLLQFVFLDVLEVQEQVKRTGEQLPGRGSKSEWNKNIPPSQWQGCERRLSERLFTSPSGSIFWFWSKCRLCFWSSHGSYRKHDISQLVVWECLSPSLQIFVLRKLYFGNQTVVWWMCHGHDAFVSITLYDYQDV